MFTAFAGSWFQAAELTASDGAAGDEFGAIGTSVAISGTTAIVGSQFHTVSGHAGQGAAYVFTGSGGSWSQTAELTASDGAAHDSFGSSVAISGPIAMVDVPYHTTSGAEQGTVYVFNSRGGNWVLTSELTSPSSGGDLFGASLALSGPTAVIGAIGEEVSGSQRGAAYLFTLVGGSWTEAAELTASDGATSDSLGYSVALSASGVVVGAPFHTVSAQADQGAAYLYSTALTVSPAPATATATNAASKNSPGCSHSVTPGDPVDCASGDFWHTFTDASIHGFGSALDLVRTYNSLNASTEGIFGYGWSSSYDSHLVVNGDGSITITEKDGSQVTATSDGSGGFTVPSWADSTLTSSGGTYTFVRQQQQTFTFNSSGQLTSIVDPNGATTSLAYTSGKLHTVTDPSGRTLTFAFGTNGLVSSVTDPMSRQTAYAYDASGNVTSVTDPLSRVTSFGYGTGASVHFMLTMTMPTGQTGGPDAGDYYTNTYDSSGRVLTQTDPKGQETTYSYSGDNSRTPAVRRRLATPTAMSRQRPTSTASCRA